MAKGRFDKGVTVTARGTSRKKAVVQGKEVAKSRIDSARKANPALNRALGAAAKGSGGMDTYRDSKADLVNAALRGRKK